MERSKSCIKSWNLQLLFSKKKSLLFINKIQITIIFSEFAFRESFLQGAARDGLKIVIDMDSCRCALEDCFRLGSCQRGGYQGGGWLRTYRRLVDFQHLGHPNYLGACGADGWKGVVERLDLGDALRVVGGEF